METERFKNLDSTYPICKFGPGGDYVSDWPITTNNSPATQKNPLTTFLTTLGDIIGATVKPELIATITADKEKTLDVIKKTNRTANAPPDGSTKGNGTLKSQAMLFADDGRISTTPKHKPHHRIRTHRRVAKKKVHSRLQGQGTLFEVDSTSQSAA